MKKIIALAIAAAMVLSLFAINSFAVYEHVVDGVIAENEYITAMEMKPDNVQTWTDSTLETSATMYIDTSPDQLLDSRLYIGIVTPKATFTEGDTYQLNVNPGNIPDDKPGLFLSFVLRTDGVRILQHNWATLLLDDDSAAGADITDLIMEAQLNTEGDDLVYEVQLPTDLFTINGAESFGFGKTLKCGFFAVIKGNQGFTTLPTKPTDWSVKGLGINDNEVLIMRDVEKGEEHTDSGVEILDFFDEEVGGVGMSFDTFFVNRVQLDNIIMENVDGGASAKLEAYGRVIDGHEAEYTSFTFRGWAGYALPMVELGYQIDDNDPVMVDNCFTVTPDIVKTVGGEYAQRFEIEVDVTGLQDGIEHDIKAVAKLQGDDGEFCYAYINQDEINANMQFYYIAPGDPPPPTDTPAPADTPEPAATPEPENDPTEAPVEEPTAEQPVATQAPEKKKGCGNFVGGSVAVICALAGVALVLRKKEN
jgi:hypothetical protein